MPMRRPVITSACPVPFRTVKGAVFNDLAIQHPGNGQGLTEPTRTAAEIAVWHLTSPFTHEVEAVLRFQGTDQHGAPWCHAAHQVQAPVQSIGPIHVDSAGWSEHGGIASRWTVEGVRGGIVAVIGLGLNNAPADAVDEELHADQRPCEFRCRTHVERSR